MRAHPVEQFVEDLWLDGLIYGPPLDQVFGLAVRYEEAVLRRATRPLARLSDERAGPCQDSFPFVNGVFDQLGEAEVSVNLTGAFDPGKIFRRHLSSRSLVGRRPA